jgi:2-phospho-L-lactate guanylyltransferase
MISTVAIIPIRSLADGKQRLRPLLSDVTRRHIITALLARTLDALKKSGVFMSIAAISPDQPTLDMIQKISPNIVPLLQNGQGLNEALDQATEWAQQIHTKAMFIIHGDLPLLTPDSIRNVIAAAETMNNTPLAFVIGDRHEEGTNALYIRPPGIIKYAFGSASFSRHIAIARDQHIDTISYYDPRLAFDLDTPNDFWQLFFRHPREVSGLFARQLNMQKCV